MKYTEEMILRSQSGYCMPFEEAEGKDVAMSLGYGEQTHPVSGEPFFHITGAAVLQTAEQAQPDNKNRRHFHKRRRNSIK